jgi:hypothetical protein
MAGSNQADRQHFLRGVRTSTANNASAYGFSLATTGSFGALFKVHGDPSWLELYVFLIGSCLGFAAVNTLSTWRFRKESPDEPELVISLATSFSAFSVCAAVGAATGIALALSGWPAWLLGSIAYTLTYIICVGGEIAFAAYRHPEGGADAEEAR